MRKYSEEITARRDFGNKENEIMLLDTINNTAGGKRYGRLNFGAERPNVSISTLSHGASSLGVKGHLPNAIITGGQGCLAALQYA